MTDSDTSQSQIDQLGIDEDYFDDSLFNIEDEVPDRKADMELAIKKYIKLIRLEDTDQALREKLVTKLIELRIRLNEEDRLDYLGHSLKTIDSLKRGCDHCGKRSKTLLPLILGPPQENSLTCAFCGFQAHKECLKQVSLSCPSLEDVLGKNFVKLSICPEIGLVKQKFQCDCGSSISLNNSSICDYDGRYYCLKCNIGDTSVIPARVIHNWDFEPRIISKKSLLAINYIRNKPILFNIAHLNSMLYGLQPELGAIKVLRSELISMVKYTRLCKQPSKPLLRINEHLINENLINSYSLNDLCDILKLRKDLTALHSQLLEHITKVCVSCRGKGFYCELCKDREDLLFPFSTRIASCPTCNAVYHKNCYHRKNQKCARCERKTTKSLSQDESL